MQSTTDWLDHGLPDRVRRASAGLPLGSHQALDLVRGRGLRQRELQAGRQVSLSSTLERSGECKSKREIT